MFRRPSLLPSLACLAGCLALVGCGSSSNRGQGSRHATLVLDFTPNAIHTGIYAAIAQGYTKQAGIHLSVQAPPSSPDSVKLLESGRADFAILDIHDLAIARAKHQPIVGLMAIVETPLAAVVAGPGVSNPKQLEDKTVGVTGDPSDLAVLDSEVKGAGGNPALVKTLTIGFNAVPALLSHRVAAATAFWNDEGLTLAKERPGFKSFRVERYGAPDYPELILCATQHTVATDPGLARSVVHAVVRGYQFTVTHPMGAEVDLEDRVQNLKASDVAAQLAAELPNFKGPTGAVGELDRATLATWARWEQRFGIVKRRPDIAAMFDPRFLPAR